LWQTAPVRATIGTAGTVAVAAPCVPCSLPRVAQPDGAARGWLENALLRMLPRRGREASPWVARAQRLFGLAALNDLVAAIEANGRTDGPAALADALQISYRFEGLENLQSVGTRPAVLFANHPTGGGNVVGMCVLLAKAFADYRILGNQHLRFLRSLSQKMIPVDPFRSTATINLGSLAKLRQQFGTRYAALGVFPAGISSRLQLDGSIADRRWSDAFIRIAHRHDALLVPVWFSGRNRLRYYLAARIRAELGFLALPAELLRLRGQSITVRVGKPIEPALLRAIPDRDAQMNFLRAGVYTMAQRPASNRLGGSPQYV
jgi:putative hemolysin